MFLPCRSSTTPHAVIAFRGPATGSRTGRPTRRDCVGGVTSPSGWTKQRGRDGKHRAAARRADSHATRIWRSSWPLKVWHIHFSLSGKRRSDGHIRISGADIPDEAWTRQHADLSARDHQEPGNAPDFWAGLRSSSASNDKPVSEPVSSSAANGPPRSSTKPNRSGAPPCRIRAGAPRRPVRKP